MVGTHAALRAEPWNGAPADGDECADQPAGRAADDSGPDARDPRDRRSVRAGGVRPGGRLADSRRALHRVSRRGRVCLGRSPGTGGHRGVPHRPALAAPIDRVLATVLFTDIVGSTEHLSRIGDARWRAQLEEHNRVVRSGLRHWRGHEVKTSGDGFWRRSTAPPAPSAVPPRSSRASPHSDSDPRRRSHRRVRAASRTTSRGSRSISPPG